MAVGHIQVIVGHSKSWSDEQWSLPTLREHQIRHKTAEYCLKEAPQSRCTYEPTVPRSAWESSTAISVSEDIGMQNRACLWWGMMHGAKADWQVCFAFPYVTLIEVPVFFVLSVKHVFAVVPTWKYRESTSKIYISAIQLKAIVLLKQLKLYLWSHCRFTGKHFCTEIIQAIKYVPILYRLYRKDCFIFQLKFSWHCHSLGVPYTFCRETDISELCQHPQFWMLLSDVVTVTCSKLQYYINLIAGVLFMLHIFLFLPSWFV